jgi:Ca2+-binding EF-hand superfamily protein
MNNRSHPATSYPDFRRELKDCFKALDTESSGEVNVSDVITALRLIGIEPRKNEIKSIIQEFQNQAGHSATTVSEGPVN